MRWGLWTHPHIQQSPSSPTPDLQGISWKRRVVFPGRPPCGNLLLINLTEPRTLCRLGALSSEAGLHMGARGLPGSAPPLPSPGHSQGAREGAGWARMAATQGTSPSSLNRPGGRVQVLVSTGELWDPLPNISPAPPHRGVQPVRGMGTPALVSAAPQRAPRGLAVRGTLRLSMGTPFSPGTLSVPTRGISR